MRLMLYHNHITPYFIYCEHMKCPFILILTELNIGHLASISFVILRNARVYHVTTHTQTHIYIFAGTKKYKYI